MNQRNSSLPAGSAGSVRNGTALITRAALKSLLPLLALGIFYSFYVAHTSFAWMDLFDTTSVGPLEQQWLWRHQRLDFRKQIALPGLQEAGPIESYFPEQSATPSDSILQDAPCFTARWGELVSGRMDNPYGVAIGPQSRIFVADTGNHRILVLDAHGQEVAVIGGEGTKTGRFRFPISLAFNPIWELYVADYANHRVQVFDREGNYLRSLGGPADKLFTFPASVAIDEVGILYVADSHRIQKFTADGRLLASWGGSGNKPGQFQYPTGLALDDSGNIYVADSWNHRVQVFSRQGALLSYWGSFGTGDGQFAVPHGVYVLPDHNILVADSYNQRIQVFSSPGKHLASFPLTVEDRCGGAYVPCPPSLLPSGQADRIFHQSYAIPRQIASDPQGVLFIADSISSMVLKMDPVSFTLTRLGTLDVGKSNMRAPGGISVDPSGNLWVADTGNHRILHFTAEGNLLGSVGQFGTREDQLAYPRFALAGSDTGLYVVDAGRHQIKKFDAAGALIRSWSSSGSGDGQLYDPGTLGFDRFGALWAADAGNSRLQKFTADGLFVLRWGSPGSSPQQLLFPSSVAGDREGNLWVADTNNHRIVQIGPDLKAVRTIGGSVDGLQNPEGIAVDEAGNIWVADTGNHRVRKYSSQGALLTQFGSRGSEEGQFLDPGGIAVGPDGSIFVADTGNNRIQVFKPDPRPLPEVALQATPNPCILAPGTQRCTIQLRANNPSGTPLQGWVSYNGGGMQALTGIYTDPVLTMDLPWLLEGTYQFFFREIRGSCSRQAQSVSVRVISAAAAVPRLSSDVPSCRIPLSSSHCRVTLTVQNAAESTLQLWAKSPYGEQLQLTGDFRDTYLSLPIPWIGNGTYDFLLYEIRGGVRGAVVATTTVNGVPYEVQGSRLTAYPILCYLASRTSTCKVSLTVTNPYQLPLLLSVLQGSGGEKLLTDVFRSSNYTLEVPWVSLGDYNFLLFEIQGSERRLIQSVLVQGVYP